MAGYPYIGGRLEGSLRAAATRPSARSLVRTPGADNDGFMNMSPVSTCGRQPSAGTLAVTESEHPTSATTRRPVYIDSAHLAVVPVQVCGTPHIVRIWMMCAVTSVEPMSRMTWFVFTFELREWDERPAG
jgi:hypothetical protein